MYLKEAFRYQNYLANLIDKSLMYLGNRSYTTRTVQEHFRKKVNPEAEDETTEVLVDRPYECSNNQLVGFLSHIMEEKEKLTAAISAAKRSCDIDIDAEIASNRLRQRVAEILDGLARLRSSESMVRGTAFKFNGEGNQVPYNYDVKQITKIDFDRNMVRDAGRALATKSDEISAAIDRVMVELVVEYTPEFSINDAFEDAVAQYVSSFCTAE